MKQVEMPKDIVKLAKDLIGSGEEGFEVIKLHVLEGESDQHDDERIDSVIQEFSKTLKELSAELEVEFGEALLTMHGEEEGDIEEEDDEQFFVPCSFSSAVWEKEDYILYLGVVQEDRELPVCLAVGVEY